MPQKPALTIVDQITPDEVTQLTTFTDGTCVSLYLPTDPTQPNPKTNSLRFKSVLTNALASLTAVGLTGEIYQNVRQNGERLLEDTLFWKEVSGSLAVCSSTQSTKVLKLSKSHPSLSMIADHFYVLPLISELSTQATYYVLELGKEHAQMWKGTEHSFTKVAVPNLPANVAEVTGVETNERQLQFHTSTSSPGGGTRPAAYHGSSTWKDDHDRYLEKFLQAVDKAIVAFTKPHPYPLVISGVEEVTVLFRGLSRYPALVEPTVSEHTDPKHHEKELHQQSWDIIACILEEARTEVNKAFEETLPDKKVTIVPEVLRQASQGKVGTLLIKEDTQLWGTFEAETGVTLIDDHQQSLSVELLNLAARFTLLNSGEIVVLPAQDMPLNATVAAMLRY